MMLCPGSESTMEQNGMYPGEALINFPPYLAPYDSTNMFPPNPYIAPSSSAGPGYLGQRRPDSYMPITNVIRIMRRGLPPNAKIADDAKDIVQECLSEFLSFVTGEANERCKSEQRKTITAEDIIWSMAKLGFDDYVEPLTIYLQRYREIEGGQAALRKEFIPIQKRCLNYGVFPSTGAAGGSGSMAATAMGSMYMVVPSQVTGQMLGQGDSYDQDGSGRGNPGSDTNVYLGSTDVAGFPTSGGGCEGCSGCNVGGEGSGGGDGNSSNLSPGEEEALLDMVGYLIIWFEHPYVMLLKISNLDRHDNLSC